MILGILTKYFKTGYHFLFTNKIDENQTYIENGTKEINPEPQKYLMST